MSIQFIVLGIVVLAGAVAAITLRNLVRCALCLMVAFAGLAGIYLQLGAQFVGFVQVLVYIGAVAILILFATLLTRGSEPAQEHILSPGWLWGAATAAAVFVVLSAFFISSNLNPSTTPDGAGLASVRKIGEQLMTRAILPLEILGLLLTAALIGAVILAVDERRNRIPGKHDSSAGAGPGPLLQGGQPPD